MTPIAIAPFKTADFNGQLGRTLAKVYLGAASLGEGLAAAGRIVDGDPKSWYEVWSGLAADLDARAEQSRNATRYATAASLYLRASEAWRQASFFHRGELDCPELQSAWPRHADSFKAAMALSPWRCRQIAIPFQGGHIHGYLLAPQDAHGGLQARPAVMVPSGYDGTAEEAALIIGLPALARGYAVLAFDGPGQGKTLYDPANRLYMRPDFEAVLPAVVDAACAAPEVDPGRIAAIGISFGGFLVPRGVSGEPRIKAMIADPGQHDIGGAMLARLPDHLKTRVDEDSAEAEAGFAEMAASPLGRMFFSPRMAAHGVATVQAYVRTLRDFTLGERANRIACPCLICDNEADAVSTSQGRQLASMIRGEVEFLRFTIAEGAGGHCEGTARELFDERAFAWLDRALAP